ncbi:WG repeat-containing protein [Bordetella bronchiseptica]|uniref:WG repeat-containing protein n=1 Tax=Bordetella bronchiseptica TaxID=518 RepID=UPI00028B7450|nr:WG repeat-containing protein [Bordetella bronchiseptica]AUL13991.1 hypothetical protein BTL45_03380 [Bordetella bronchiseptica]AWP57082.1 hypothetical protein B7P02_03385 [Bordetella bronchiseptica]AWQ03851.1 hypothetical protein B9G73_03560 [Bordetella bronchiseptica]AZW29357.1 hypothetical protein CS343_03585 [Bordetella bronchiseptica]KCV39757.1 hypothetical protein L572_0788 [Bordetella bronchiseptica 345]
MRLLPAMGALALLLHAPAAPAQDFDRHGHALVRDAQGWVYIDRAHRPVLRPFIYDNGPDYYEEGLARFVDHGRMGFHDEALNIVIPAEYDFVFPFQGGKARAGTDCRVQRHGEHGSVSCRRWTTLTRP